MYRCYQEGGWERVIVFVLEAGELNSFRMAELKVRFFSSVFFLLLFCWPQGSCAFFWFFSQLLSLFCIVIIKSFFFFFLSGRGGVRCAAYVLSGTALADNGQTDGEDTALTARITGNRR